MKEEKLIELAKNQLRKTLIETKDKFPFSNGVRNYHPETAYYTGKDVKDIILKCPVEMKGVNFGFGITFRKMEFIMNDGKVISEDWGNEVWFDENYINEVENYEYR